MLTSALAGLKQVPRISPVTIEKTDEGGKGRGQPSGLPTLTVAPLVFDGIQRSLEDFEELFTAIVINDNDRLHHK